MISNLDALAERLDAEQHGHSRVYRIGATPNPALRLVPEAYIATRRKFPNLVVELVESSTDELLMALARGEYSLILGRSSSLDDRTGLKQTPLYPEIGVILGRTGHPARRRRQRNLDSLLSYPWIFPQHGPTRAAIELAFMRAGCNPPTPAFINYGTLLVCDILSRSDALAVLPFGAARQVLDSQAIAMIDVNVDFQLPAYAMYEPALAIADPVLASFQTALLEAASNLDESRREQKKQLSRLRR
jgi:DNA-binding transcriptional LysR family regulator